MLLSLFVQLQEGVGWESQYGHPVAGLKFPEISEKKGTSFTEMCHVQIDTIQWSMLLGGSSSLKMSCSKQSQLKQVTLGRNTLELHVTAAG